MADGRASTPLKAVPGGKPTRAARTRKEPTKKSVKDAAASGNQRQLLIATRDRIATAVDSPATPPRDLAALTRRLLDIAKELAALDAAENSDDVGDAAATPDASWPAT
jgi:hypothetical protein